MVQKLRSIFTSLKNRGKGVNESLSVRLRYIDALGEGIIRRIHTQFLELTEYVRRNLPIVNKLQ